MLRSLLPVLLAVSLPAAPVTFAFESTSPAGYRFELDYDRFLPPTGDLLSQLHLVANFCFAGPTPCPGLTLATYSALHSLIFDFAHSSFFPVLTFSQPGATLSSPNSLVDGRFVAYERHPDLVYEYFFKDSTGTRTFRYQTPRMLVRDTDLTGPGLQACTATPGNSCGPAQLNMDFAGLDALGFTDGGLPFAYFFPQLAFSTLGIHQTSGGAFSGVLTVSLVRPDLPDPPPAAVPEPTAAALALLGLLALQRHARARTLPLGPPPVLRSLLPILLAVSLPAAPVTFAFESSSGYRFEYDSPQFLGTGDRLLSIEEYTNFCFAGPDPCPALSLVANDPLHTVIFGAGSGANFASPAFSQPGAALALPGSTFDARFVAYERHADRVYEYFFKDSTGTRTFRYQTPRMLVRDTDLTGSGLRDCTATPGNSCGPIQLNMDFAGLDALGFTDGLPFSYFFPQLAFSTLGIHQTTGAGLSGVLTVRLVRPDLPEPPPAAVPEPTAAALALLGLLALQRHARARVLPLDD